MNPEALVRPALADGRLIELVPGCDLLVPLHWHVVRGAPVQLHDFGRCVLEAAGAVLVRAA